MSNHTHDHEMKVYGEIKLFAGTGSPGLAARIAKYLNTPLCEQEVIEFPNENLFVKLKHSVRGQDVYVIQHTSSPVHRNLMELLITIQTLRLDSAARITVVVPYLAYGRSDKKDQPRVPISARLVADMIEVDHVNKNLKPNLKDPVVVAADLGFAKKGRNFAADIDAPIAFVEKRRAANDAKAEALSVIGTVKNHDVLIVDDEVDTGGSIAQAVNQVKREGARDVYLIFVHPIFSGDAAQRLAALPIKHIITTDTVPIPPEKLMHLKDRITILSVAELLGEVIRRAHEGRSVGEMFNE